MQPEVWVARVDCATEVLTEASQAVQINFMSLSCIRVLSLPTQGVWSFFLQAYPFSPVFLQMLMQVKLCNRFHIRKYPTMKFGHGPDFDEGSEQELAELSGKKSAEEVVKWLSKQLDT